MLIHVSEATSKKQSKDSQDGTRLYQNRLMLKTRLRSFIYLCCWERPHTPYITGWPCLHTAAMPTYHPVFCPRHAINHGCHTVSIDMDPRCWVCRCCCQPYHVVCRGAVGGKPLHPPRLLPCKVMWVQAENCLSCKIWWGMQYVLIVHAFPVLDPKLDVQYV